jgi:hypothetical protein
MPSAKLQRRARPCISIERAPLRGRWRNSPEIQLF